MPTSGKSVMVPYEIMAIPQDYTNNWYKEIIGGLLGQENWYLRQAAAQKVKVLMDARMADIQAANPSAPLSNTPASS